jgi:hypothetical protein
MGSQPKFQAHRRVHPERESLVFTMIAAKLPLIDVLLSVSFSAADNVERGFFRLLAGSVAGSTPEFTTAGGFQREHVSPSIVTRPTTIHR